MSTGWNPARAFDAPPMIINLLGNEYWLERGKYEPAGIVHYKPTGK